MPVPKGTVREAWESYALSVLPKDAPRVQFTECRRAFYAGAHSTLQRFIEVGGDEVNEDDGAAHLENLTNECWAFQRDVAEGRA